MNTTKKNASIGCAGIILLIAAIIITAIFSDDTPPQVPAEKTAQPDSAPPPAPPPPDHRPDKQKFSDFDAAIRKVDAELVTADGAFQSSMRNAEKNDSSEMARSAYDQYHMDVMSIEGEANRYPIPLFETENADTISENVDDAMEAQSDGIQARELIATGVDKIEGGDFASYLAYEQSVEINTDDIEKDATKEAIAMRRARAAARRLFGR